MVNRYTATGSKARAHCRALGLLAVLLAGSAFAQVGPVSSQSLFFDAASNAHEGNYLAVGVGLDYTDNATLTPSGGPSATIGMLGLVGDVSREGPLLDLRLASDIALLKYLNSTYPTQPTGYLDGAGDLKIVPGIFSWTARETYSEAILDPVLPLTPDNLESLNYITTGPRFILQPTLRTTIVLDGSYSYVSSSSKSPQYVNIDNHRYAADLTLNYALWNGATAYLTGSDEQIRFKDQVDNTDFTDIQGLAGFRYSGARTALDIAGGYAEIRSGTGPTAASLESRGFTGRVELSRMISAEQRLSFHATKDVTDAANQLRLDFNQAVPTTAPSAVLTSEPVTVREFGANWRYELNRTAMELDLLSSSDRYPTPGLDVDFKSAAMLFARKISPTLNWDIGGTFQHSTFAIAAPQNTIYGVTNLRWNAGRRLEVRFMYAHSTLTPHGYKDNQFALTVSYALVEHQRGEPGAPARPASLRPMSPLSAQPYRP